MFVWHSVTCQSLFLKENRKILNVPILIIFRPCSFLVFPIPVEKIYRVAMQANMIEFQLSTNQVTYYSGYFVLAEPLDRRFDSRAPQMFVRKIWKYSKYPNFCDKIYSK